MINKTSGALVFLILLFISFNILSCQNNDKAGTEKPVPEKAVPEKTKSSDPFPTFTDVMKKTGLGNVGYLGQTASWVDFNNDGKLDLLLGNTDLRNTSLFLFKNTGDRFVDVLEDSELFPEPVRSSAWADFDNDGRPDLLLGTIRAAFPPKLYKNIDGEFFEDITEKAGLMNKKGTVRHSIWGDYNSDGYVDIFQVNFGKNYLYKNNGNGTFTDVSEQSGITANGRSDSAVFFDANNDGHPDIYVANSGTNILYMNNGDGTFADKTEKSGLGGEANWSTVSICTGDFNNDGFIDLYIGNISSSRNALYRNNGDGTFTDITVQTGTSDVGDARTCAWLDFDNDGKLDLLTTNHTASNNLYHNLGEDKFQNMATELGMRRPVDVYSVSIGDYNNDSLIDILLTGHLGKALLENSGNMNTSLIIELTGNGKTTNRSAIDSRVIVNDGKDDQIREVSGGRGCCEQDMLPVHFGLGKQNKVNIEVKWTDGTSCNFPDVEIKTDTTLSVKQDGCELSRIR